MKNVNVYQIIISFVLLNIGINNVFALTAKQIYQKYQSAVGIVVTTDENNQPLSQGSGFFITADGAFVTNVHVVQGAQSIIIKKSDGSMYFSSEYVGYNSDLDLVILKVEGKEIPHVKLGNSMKLNVGDGVIVIGSPRGLENSISKGMVSSIRNSQDGSIRLIQTTAEVSPGNSGGPLFDVNGEVVGVITFVVGQGESLTFAIPIEYVMNIYNESVSSNNDVVPEEMTPMYYWLAGMMAEDVKNYELAKGLYLQAIDLDKNFDKAYYSVADIFYEERKFKDELIVYEELIKIKPKDVDARFSYGLTLENNNKENEAIEQYKKALKIKPNHQDALFNIGFLYILHDRHKEAKSIIKKLKKNNQRWASQLERLLNKIESNK